MQSNWAALQTKIKAKGGKALRPEKRLKPAHASESPEGSERLRRWLSSSDLEKHGERVNKTLFDTIYRVYKTLCDTTTVCRGWRVNSQQLTANTLTSKIDLFSVPPN